MLSTGETRTVSYYAHICCDYSIYNNRKLGSDVILRTNSEWKKKDDEVGGDFTSKLHIISTLLIPHLRMTTY